MRIITGRARGTNLFTPKNYDVRPTADRVKESVFNILGFRIAGAVVWDAFAGTGNLGLECWSRGAGQVIFTDKSRESLGLVRRNVEKCHAAADCLLLQGDAPSLVAKLARQGNVFDYIFLDPPYRQGLIDRMLSALADVPRILRPGGLVVAERGAEEDAPGISGNWQLCREEKYGSTVIDFIGRMC